MRNALKAVSLALATLGAACADPAAEHLMGFGDPVRGAALHAPRMLGDTARLAGRPAAAARAAVQLEVLTTAFHEDPRYAHEATGAVQHSTRLGQAELRRAIGIAPAAPSDSVVATLREAAEALDQGRPARAEAALTGPDYPEGGAATLARLGTLPHLPRVAEAAGAAYAEIRRIDRQR